MMRKFLSIKRWQVITFGVILTALSAIISHYVVDANNQRIILKEAAVAEHSQTIDQLWQTHQNIEQKYDIWVVLDHLPQDAMTEQYIATLFALVGKPVPAQAKQQALYRALMEHKHKTLEQINQLYAENLSLKQMIAVIKGRSNSFEHLALFLQIFGLILVLSRDLFAK